MWLEGAVQNGWSVSHMRGQRWEAMGANQDLRPSEDEIVQAEVAGEGASGAVVHAHPVTTAAVKDVEDAAGGADGPAGNSAATDAPSFASAPSHPLAGLPELPDDLAEAFEQFKLSILNHKLSGWQAVARSEVLACLEALKELALADA